MTITVGVGALIEQEQFNILRNIELSLAVKTGNWYGLGQPPHIAIKRPFQMEKARLEYVQSAVRQVAQGFGRFSVRLSGCANFDKKVLYIQVGDNAMLFDLHDQLLTTLASLYKKSNQSKGPDMIFHSTLAMNLSPEEYEIASSEMKKLMPSHPIVCDIKKIGVFLSVDNSRHWVVIGEYPLSGSHR